MTSSLTSDLAVDFLDDGPADAAVLSMMGHDADAPTNSPLRGRHVEGLAATGHHILRFNFPCMARLCATGVKPHPDRQDKLLAS